MSEAGKNIYELAADPEVKAALAKIPHVAALPASVTVDHRVFPKGYPCVRRGRIVAPDHSRKVALLRLQLIGANARLTNAINKIELIRCDISRISKELEELA